MSDKVRLASVGLGRWARVLARGAQRGDKVELYSCFSRDPEKRSAFAEEFGIPSGRVQLRGAAGRPGTSRASSSPPRTTPTWRSITQALQAGKAVYTDKPIAHTLEDANQIAAVGRETGSVFAVGHSSRRLSGHREMKRWIEDGRLGEVSLAEANFSNERGLELTPDTWRWYADKSPGGAFIQLGVHHADTLQFLLGPVKSVSAHARKLFTKAEVPGRDHGRPRVRERRARLHRHRLGLPRRLLDEPARHQGQPDVRPRLHPLGRVPPRRRLVDAALAVLRRVRAAGRRAAPHRHVP